MQMVVLNKLGAKLSRSVCFAFNSNFNRLEIAVTEFDTHPLKKHSFSLH